MDTNYQFDLGLTPQPARRKSRWLKPVGVAVSIAIVAFLVVYSGGMEYMLKLLGVGASGIYDATITNNQDFIGNSQFFADGSAPEMNGVSVFDRFSGTPQDPNLDEKNKGFVAAIFSSPQEPANETYIDHFYVSAAIDLTLDRPLLSAVETTEFNSPDSNITYAYRTSAKVSTIPAAAWQPLDMTVVNSTTEDNVKVKTAVVEQNVEQFVQLKFTFVNVDPFARAAVYALSLQYKDGEATPGGMIGDSVTEREVSLQYQSTNAPANIDIDVLSSELDNRVVYTQKQVDLSQRQSYTFTTTLASGAYALVVSGATIETKIMPFQVGASDTQVQVNLGSFDQPTGQNSTYDLNGDRVVNSVDLLILMSQFTS